MPPVGLEPTALRLRGGCSDHLSYKGLLAEAGRIELPTGYQPAAVFETVSSSMPDNFQFYVPQTGIEPACHRGENPAACHKRSTAWSTTEESNLARALALLRIRQAPSTSWVVVVVTQREGSASHKPSPTTVRSATWI